MWAKIELPTTERRKEKALSGYIECEKEVRHAERRFSSDDDLLRRFRRVSVLLWADSLSSIDLAVYRGDLIPTHSAGATADRLSGNGKWNQSEWTTRLDEILPSWEGLMHNVRDLHSGGAEFSDSRENPVPSTLLEPGDERPVRVIIVPKTLKTPRVIAMEPTCMQYMQQGLLSLFTRELQESNRLEVSRLGFPRS